MVANQMGQMLSADESSKQGLMSKGSQSQDRYEMMSHANLMQAAQNFQQN
jgi:hypothetical protein